MSQFLATTYDDEENEIPLNMNYPERNYERQENCAHNNFTLMFNHGRILFKCKCTLTRGEDGMEIFMPKLMEEWEKQKGRRVEEVLLA